MTDSELEQKTVTLSDAITVALQEMTDGALAAACRQVCDMCASQTTPPVRHELGKWQHVGGVLCPASKIHDLRKAMEDE